MRTETKKNLKIFAISILIPLAVGGLAAFITRDNMDMFSEVNMPPLSPPPILFPIVWAVLYILMGISSGIVWKKKNVYSENSSKGLMYYGASLIFNFGWSIIFFNLKQYLLAFVWLLILLYLIIMTIIQYKKVSSLSAYLQIPYAIWVSFAGYLTAGIWWLNR